MGMKYKAPAERFYPWDHESAIVLGKALGVSPKRIQALVRGYLAGLGLGIMGLSDIIVRQFAEFPERPDQTVDSLPLVGRFVKSTPARYSRYQSEFYEIFDELNLLTQKIRSADLDMDYARAARIHKENQKKLSMFPEARRVRAELSRIRKEVLGIWKHQTMSGEKKREELDKLTIRRNKEVKKFYEWYIEATKS
jgi:hypothetical protein